MDTLKDLIKKNGRSLKWVLEQLKKKNFIYSREHFSRVCSDKHIPHDNRFYSLVADILDTTEKQVKRHFKHFRK